MSQKDLSKFFSAAREANSMTAAPTTTPTSTPDDTLADLEAEFILSRNDRCDRCGAAAGALVTTTAGDLLFCGHHYRAYFTALQAAGYQSHAEKDAQPFTAK